MFYGNGIGFQYPTSPAINDKELIEVERRLKNGFKIPLRLLLRAKLMAYYF